MAYEVEVHVSVVIDSVSPLAFHFETTDLPMGSNNVLYFRNCKRGQDFLVNYELVGAPGYRFPQTLGDAIYSKVGSKTDCPSTNGIWGQFTPEKLMSSSGPGGTDRILQVRNRNDTPADFAYTLRATDGTNWLNIDPGGVNGNGGLPLYSQFTYVAGAALVGAAATYAGLMAAGLIQG